MTDARFPHYWMHDARIQRLSGDHFRAFMHTLAWSVSNGTDGVIRFECLPLIYRVDADAMAAFVAADLCAEIDDGWLITVYQQTQTTRAQLESSMRAKANARERQARKRLKEHAAQEYVTRDVTRDVPGDSVGKARQGKALSNETKGLTEDSQIFSNGDQPQNLNSDEPPPPEEPTTTPDGFPLDDGFDPAPYEPRIRANIERGYER